jgi:hypothetical protein
LAKLYACFPESDTEAMSFCVRREMAAGSGCRQPIRKEFI